MKALEKALKAELPQTGAWHCAAALLLALPLLAPTAGAQAPQGRTDVGDALVVEEIIVTARKRQESLLEIPESVAAIAGAAINRENLRTLEDIGVKVPNLNLATRLDGFPNVSIRGLGSFGNTQGVGFYLDDVQVFSDASSRFGDLERIEVLKGPQGTLYGGSNIGGAIKFVSARPDPEETFGRVKLQAGEQSLLDGEASVNLPLGGDWALRAFGFAAAHDGYLKNPNSVRLNGLRTDNDEDVGKMDEWGLRASIAGPLSDSLSAYASVRYNEFDGPNNTWVRELDPTQLEHPNIVATSTNPRHERDTIGLMLELVLALEGVDVTSVTSFTDTDSVRYSDLDIREEFLLDLIRPEDMTVYTQELRFTSTGDGPLQWLGGLYYSLYEEEMDADLIWFNTQALPDGNFTGPLGCAAELPTCSGIWAGETVTLEQELLTLRTPFEKRLRDKSHLAAFANLTYALAEDWELAAGLRIDRWRNESANLDSGITSKRKATEVLPRASLTRRFDNSIAYATIARGYEPGGFNLASFAGVNELLGFDAEKATSYEIGWKGGDAAGRVTATAAVFYIDYKARQVEYQAEDASGGVIEGIVNLGNSRQYGLEADIAIRVTDALRVSVAAGWVEAEWKNGTSAAGVDLSGETPPVVPDFNFNVSADYRQPIQNGMELIAGVQLSHTGSYEGLLAWKPVTNPSYTVVNAQLGLAGENWQLTAHVKNLFDEDYYSDVQHFPNFFALDGGEHIVIGTLGQPRLASLSLSFFF